MSRSDISWTDRFPKGERVQFLDDLGDVVQLHEVFTRGDTYLHFLVAPTDPLYDRMKFSNRLTLRSLRTGVLVDGTVSMLDHRPGFHDSIISDRSPDNPGKRLVKFETEPFRSDVTTSGETFEDRTKAWSVLLHLRSLPATVIPIMLGVLYSLWMNWDVSVPASILAFTGGGLLHVASNIHNELSDFHQALVENSPVQENTINRYRFNPTTIWRLALGLYGVSVLAGVPLWYFRGGDFLAVGVLGFLIASFYSLHQHTTTNYAVLRDVLMFVLMGPLMAVASAIAASGHWDIKLCLVALPISCFVALILHEHEIYNIPIDRRAGATTLAILLGFRGSKQYYGLLILLGYLGIAVMSFAELIPYWTLLSFLSLPYAIYTLKLLKSIESPLNPKMDRLRYSTSLLHVFFGMFYLIGFLTEVYL